jgi:hypothetical protein
MQLSVETPSQSFQTSSRSGAGPSPDRSPGAIVDWVIQGAHDDVDVQLCASVDNQGLKVSEFLGRLACQLGPHDLVAHGIVAVDVPPLIDLD